MFQFKVIIIMHNKYYEKLVYGEVNPGLGTSIPEQDQCMPISFAVSIS